MLLSQPYAPRHELRFADATFYLSDLLHDDGLGFLVAYVVLGERGEKPVRRIHPRLFYKDSSLLWRVASHFIHDETRYWIGKGDVRREERADGEYICSVEETANLPYELQASLDAVSRRRRRRRAPEAVELVVRQAPSGRIAPYADFTTPRRRAQALRSIHGNRPIARFQKTGDPGSLRFVRGYEPDFRNGVVEVSASHSQFFGGALGKYRILSTNGRIQYFFIASPTHAWVNPPQTLEAELSTYGVRLIDVQAADDVFVPAFEYHERGDGPDGDVLYSQIPAGFAGAPHPLDPDRSDASAWIEALPVIQQFRALVLRGT